MFGGVFGCIRLREESVYEQGKNRAFGNGVDRRRIYHTILFPFTAVGVSVTGDTARGKPVLLGRT